MSKEFDRRKGLTLMEMVVTMAIAAVVLTITLTIYNMWWKSYNNLSEKAVIEREMTSAMEIIVKELRLAKDVQNDNSNLEDLELESGEAAFGIEEKRIGYKVNDRISYLTDPVVETLLFTTEENNKNFLEIRIANSRYGILLTSKVKLLNVDEISEGSSSAIRFLGAVKLF